MIDETAMVWLQLRERRGSIHNRSALLADSASRRKTFAAAMQQFEEQMTAAKVVTPATSPINLYYGLTQAGTAIAAARSPATWTVSSHGLKLGDTRPDLPDIRVQESGTGAFQVVAAATGSPGIAGPASIGSLWQSLPDLSQAVPLPGTHSPAALPVIPETPPAFDASGSGIPTRVLFFQPPGATVEVVAILPDPDKRETWCRELLSHYPTAVGWNPDAPTRWFTDEAGERPVSSITLRLPGPPRKYPLSRAEAEPLYDQLAPEYRDHHNRYMRPFIQGANGPSPSTLMTWWLLLYSFSMLARYQPRKWTDLLNLDKPGCATHIQYALEAANSAIPHLVLEALDGHPILLADRPSFRTPGSPPTSDLYRSAGGL